jgi:eukaryotic-like serine/threonine-protein kinase
MLPSADGAVGLLEPTQMEEDIASLRDLTELVDVGGIIGRGGMAEIYEATHRVTGESVALKRIVPKLAVRSSLRLRFANEVDLLERCRGRYVLDLRAYGVWSDTPAYIAERCVGSLSDLGRDRVVPLPRVLRWTAEILAGLDRVHAAGAVHRDIKPSNVLVVDDGSIRLADFGIARHPSRRLTAVGHAVGTPCYSAPDLAANPRDAAPAHDLFSVGLLVLALSTHLRTRSLTDPAERDRTLARFPDDTRRLLERATSPDPAARYGSASEMANDVQRAIISAG